MYQAFRYLTYRSLVNSFKQLIKSPKKIITAVLVLAWITIMFFAMFGSKGDGQAGQAQSTTIYLWVFLGFQALFICPSFVLGLYKSSLTFSLPDIQFLFTAPVRPQTNLLYAFVRNLPAYLLSGIFILYQAINLKSAGFSYMAIFTAALTFGWNLFVVGILSMLCYALARDREYLRWVFITIFFLPLAILLTFLASQVYLNWGKLSLDFFTAMIHLPGVRLLPIFGWATNLVLAFKEGFDSLSYLSLAGLLVLPAVSLFFLYRQDLDYYEDAISLAKNQQEVKDLTKTSFVSSRRSQREVKAQLLSVKNQGLGGGWAASSQYYRIMAEEKRQARLPLWSHGLVKLAFLGLIFGLAYFFLPRFTPLQGENIWLIFKHCGLLAYFGLVFIGSLSGSTNLVLEFSQPQFPLLPVKSESLVAYTILPGLVKSLLAQLPAALVLALVMGWPGTIIPSLVLGLCLVLVSISLKIIQATGQILVFTIFGELKGILSALVLNILLLISLVPTGIIYIRQLVIYINQCVSYKVFAQVAGLDAVQILKLCLPFLILGLIQSLFLLLAVKLGAHLIRRGRA